MKNTIKLTALFLLASASLFAATPVKTKAALDASKNIITISSLPSNNGLDIKVDRAETGNAIVMIYDQDMNVIFKDVLTTNKSMEKGYILNQLENGDYTIEVISNKQTVKKDIHIYDEDGARAFFVKE